MTKKSIMTPAILKTILNSAPIIIQGTSKLIQIIKERNDDQSKQEQDIPATIEGLKSATERLEQRLDKSDDSDVEQIKLIEQLAVHHVFFVIGHNRDISLPADQPH